MFYLLLAGSAFADYSKRNPFLLVLLIVLSVALLGVGGFILYRYLTGKKNAPTEQAEDSNDDSNEETEPKAHEEPTPESEEKTEKVSENESQA